MSALAFDLDGQPVGRRHQRPRPDGEFAKRKTRIIVHPKNLLDSEALHQPVLHHRLAAGAALLGRLEDHHGGAGEIARLGEIARGAEQHGGVAVMAAGVHLARHDRFVGHVIGFLDRQRVHVSAQSDHLLDVPALAATNDADYAGTAEAAHHLVAAKCFELLSHRCRGAMHVIEEFGMGVQVAPPGLDLVMQVGNAVDDRHRMSSCAAGRHRPLARTYVG